jgi:hypothetical protein
MAFKNDVADDVAIKNDVADDMASVWPRPAPRLAPSGTPYCPVGHPLWPPRLATPVWPPRLATRRATRRATCLAAVGHPVGPPSGRKIK